MCPASGSIKAGTQSLKGVLILEFVMSSQQRPLDSSGGEDDKRGYSNNGNSDNKTSGTPGRGHNQPVDEQALFMENHYRMPVR